MGALNKIIYELIKIFTVYRITPTRTPILVHRVDFQIDLQTKMRVETHHMKRKPQVHLECDQTQNFNVKLFK